MKFDKDSTINENGVEHVQAPPAHDAAGAVPAKKGWRSRMRDGEFWTRDRIVWLILGVALGIGLIFLMNRLSDVLLPFFAACLIAYLLNPIVMFCIRKLHFPKRWLAVIVTLLAVAGVLTGLVFLCRPMISDEVGQLAEMVKRYGGSREMLSFVPAWAMEYVRNFDIENLRELLNSTHIEALFSKGTGFVVTSLESLLRIVEWLLMFVYIVFILLDYDKIANGFRLIFPSSIREQAMGVVGDVEKAMNSYFRGQGFVALCACVLYCIGFRIVGLPLSLMMGILVGVLYMIPYFQYVTLIPVAVICFIASLNGDVGFLSLFGKSVLVYVVSQCVCDYLITPHVMGKEMGLNPAMILLALSVWGSLLGILGMIIALPATALILAYYERYISR